ncbi:MAG: class I SAM-dependent methyltransferase [Promethearchaeota archaeon]
MIYMDMDKIYRDTPLNKLPWNYETPPESLIEIVKSGKIQPCNTIDLGCGTGNYALYFATKGFKVTGIDISSIAVSIARKKASEKGVDCRFLVKDVVGELNESNEKYDFAYDWELLHHIFPEKRIRYVENVYKILNPEAKYLSVNFNEKDPCFGGQGKYRETPLGTVLYFSSMKELKTLFEPFFKIIEIKTREIRGKPNPHIVNYVFMERK